MKTRHPIRLGLTLLALWTPVDLGHAQSTHTLSSPDGRIMATVTLGEHLVYSISWDYVELIAPSPISMTLGDGTVLGRSPRLSDSLRRAVDEIIEPVVPEKSSRIRDRYNELIFEDGVNAHRRAEDYRRVEWSVGSGETLSIRLAPGGGWAARIARADR